MNKAKYHLGSTLRQVALRFALILVVAMGAVTSAHAQTAAAQNTSAILRLHIVELLTSEQRLPLPVQQRREALKAYYDDLRGEFLWLSTDRPAALIARLQSAHHDGLRPQDYPATHLEALTEAIPIADARSQAVIELHLSAAFLEYASDLQVGRFLPSRVDPDFFLQGHEFDQLAALEGLSSSVSPDAFFAAWQPATPEYAALRQTLFEHEELASTGGWASVPFGETLKFGMHDQRIVQLRARLAATDGANASPSQGNELLFDDQLVAVVERFQARHGLDVDGAVGPATIAALNVSVDERIANIIVAMERWRWMAKDLGQHYLIVNIAGFELRRVRDGNIEERMNVVVGKPYHRTPVFSDNIRYLELNPYWNVPSSIALGEQLEQLHTDPGALAARGFEAVLDDTVYDLTAIDWRQFGPDNFPFRIRQRPGSNNALGRVKFMFPNSHNVYLHDTPARSLFSRSERAFSHGCVRLARPLDLASQVFAAGNVSGWDRARIDQVLASGERTVVNLAQQVPVHITYLTAWVDAGTPHFRADIYEHDQKLIAALDGRSIAW